MNDILKSHAGLFTDLYELTMAQGYFLTGKFDKPACFDYFFRKLPFKGGYVIFAGLDDLLNILKDLSFDEEDIQYLRALKFDNRFLEYLKKFKFRGSVFSANEGEIIFPNEPVLNVQGTVLETQIVETLVLNILNFQSLIATKANRVCLAAEGRSVIDFGLRRAQGLGGIHASRAAIIGGVDATSNVYSAKMYGITPTGTMAHSWIESFDSELDAFRKFAEIFPDNCTFLVDTYNTLQSGIPNAIVIAHELVQKGHQLKAVRLDSGDLAYLSKQARKMLDASGLNYVKIVVSNQLDEYVIKSLLDQGAPIDAFGVGTSLIVGRDDAALDGVYKLSMFNHRARLKISDNVEKILLPGIKKIYRYIDDANNFHADAVVGTDEEDIQLMLHPYQPKQLLLTGLRKENLLNYVMNKGQIITQHNNVYDLAKYSRKRLEFLPAEHKRFEYPHIYKVGISRHLIELRDSLLKQHVK